MVFSLKIKSNLALWSQAALFFVFRKQIVTTTFNEDMFSQEPLLLKIRTYRASNVTAQYSLRLLWRLIVAAYGG